MIRRRIIGGCLVAGLGLTALLFLHDRLFFDPLLFCLTPPPSEATVVRAIRFGPGDGGSGIGPDGRTYSVKPLECPHWAGVGSPKLKMLLRMSEGQEVVEEKIIGVAIIDSNRVVVSRFW
ncbi:hypothetical protein TFLX_04946 [Thermoflexales bacterium]|nr:hypothetical protein TFLX_04946 [Thermoflexales bacterium]